MVAMDDEHVGARLRRWRHRRGLSQRVLAELAGFSQGYIAQIERGSTPLDRYASQEAIARALQISVRELTGRENVPARYQPVDDASVAVLRSGIIALSYPQLVVVVDDDPGSRPHTPTAEQLDQHFYACRYDVLVPALGSALTRLAYRLHACADDEKRRLLREAVEICSTAASTCMQLGYPDLALTVAELAARTAREHGDPRSLGLANYARLRAVASEPGAIHVAREGVELLSAHVGTSVTAASTYGMHHLVSAWIVAGTGQRAKAFAHLDEAKRVAAYTGECPEGNFNFGPTNVDIWRVAILVALEEGSAAKAPTAAAGLESMSRHRRATYFIDLARALLQGRGSESAAAAALYQAEAIAPQQVSVYDGGRAAARELLSRPRFGRDGRLRGLAKRLGVLD
ncbi:helix-turn-helix domain-containing protein [Phytohabitans sp. LJ34]|uniref:helix-turn-helix domain-containing protein n=1 Tax=Phytohabitans sp. LJ34 TaxID=3452217 RepID=UPI003F8B25EB